MGKRRREGHQVDKTMQAIKEEDHDLIGQEVSWLRNGGIPENQNRRTCMEEAKGM